MQKQLNRIGPTSPNKIQKEYDKKKNSHISTPLHRHNKTLNKEEDCFKTTLKLGGQDDKFVLTKRQICLSFP